MPDQALDDEGSSIKPPPESPTSSWTDIISRTDHNALFLNADYAATSLGPIKDWGTALRLYASLVFSDSRPACVYWGPNRVAFYNEGFQVCCGGVQLMAKGFQEAFPTLWESMGPVFDEAAATAKTVDVNNILLFPDRHGYLEETYFVGQFIPLRAEGSSVEGFYNTVYETTSHVLHVRRRKVVDLIASIPVLSVDDTLLAIMGSLKTNPHDITMAIIYSFDEAMDDNFDLRLCGSIAVPEGHFPANDRLETSNAGLVPYFRKVQLSGKPLVLSRTDGSLPKDLFERVDWCGYGEASRDVVVVPLRISGNLLGFYVQGTNPRRAYDEATEMSIIDIARQMESKWNQSMSAEQAKEREQALERRALDSENRLKHMALSAPIGMVQIDSDEKIQWANDQFYQITGHDRSKPDMSAFRDCIAPESRQWAHEGLRLLLEGASAQTREYELVRKWKCLVGDERATEEVSAWMLTSSFPLMEDGKVKLVMGYVMDISHQKWAEDIQKGIAETATQAKHRQEEFIDFVSHEIRNPLSAITQLADGIAQSQEKARTRDVEATSDTIVEENVESAITILALTTIQRRVIDDVLILSRLESEVLSITPVIERPWKVVRDTVAMFRGEARLHDMQFEVLKDDSYNVFNVEWVYIDTSRLAQILINLLSNAVKFTASRSVRKITVTYGAQTGKPHITSSLGEIEWITLDTNQPDVPLRPLRQGEETLYLYFCVKDTGMGISQLEKSRLFKRFSQASAKTHIAYGGSGLGLYICKQLANRQGGSIGLASRRGEGTAFGFYIETRPAPSPERDSKDRLPPSSATDLPMRIPSNLDVEGTISGPKGSNRVSKQSPKQSEPGMTLQRPTFHILLVEDNLVNQKVLAKQLRAANCTVTIANHGQEALEKLEQTDCWRDFGSEHGPDADRGKPRLMDVVLMDVEMPVMNGLDCSRRIRALEEEGQITRHVPIIAITANARQEQQDTALDAGMDSVLSKPFVVQELLDSIQDVLEATHAAV